MLDELDFLEEYQEDNRIEAKRAQGGLPHSLWETYSAFANTLGGVILLGVAEGADKSLYSVPLFDPQELVDEFWDMVNDPTVVSANILEVEAGTTGYQAATAATAVAPTSASRMQPARIWKSAAMSTSMAAPALRSSLAATVR